MSLLTKLKDLEEIHFSDLDPKMIEDMRAEIGRTSMHPTYEDSIKSFLVSSFLRYSGLASQNVTRAYAEKDDENRVYFIRMSRRYLRELPTIILEAEKLSGDFSPYRYEKPDGTVTDTPLTQIEYLLKFWEEELEFLETQPRSKHYTYKVLMREMIDAVEGNDFEMAGKLKVKIGELTND